VLLRGTPGSAAPPPELRVLGIDPGLVATGYGCLASDRAGVTVVDAGVITTSPRAELERRLWTIHDGIVALLERLSPSLLVVEDLYSEYKFPRTAILMGHARGVICLAAAQRGVSVLPLAPAEVKRLVAANGGASKTQVGRGVQTILRLPDTPRPSHVADALSLALTGISRAGGRVR
jgi:crossover junction endodeoxyribonuclease RuvC